MKHNNRNIVAIDIAKDTLQIKTSQHDFSVTNNQSDFTRLQQRITNALDNPLVVCESTGGYERPLLAFLHAKRIDVALINPRLIRAFALSEGIAAAGFTSSITRVSVSYLLNSGGAQSAPPFLSRGTLQGNWATMIRPPHKCRIL